jgi:hypothetical protein
LFGGKDQWEEEGGKEKVKRAEYDQITSCISMKISNETH